MSSDGRKRKREDNSTIDYDELEKIIENKKRKDIGLTKLIMKILQQTGAMCEPDLVKLVLERYENKETVAADVQKVLKLLAATPLIKDMPLVGDKVRKDRPYQFLNGFPLDEAIPLDQIMPTLTKETAEVSRCRKRIQRIKRELGNLGNEPDLENPSDSEEEEEESKKKPEPPKDKKRKNEPETKEHESPTTEQQEDDGAPLPKDMLERIVEGQDVEQNPLYEELLNWKKTTNE